MTFRIGDKVHHSYINGFVAGAGLATIVDGTVRGNLTEAIIAGSALVLYEGYRTALQQERQYVGRLIQNGKSPLEIAMRLIRL